nr:RHS repeat-associated core domain-containing protein [uncultured Treponema sp.]
MSGRYGQLTQVNLPQGGNVEIDYAEQFGTPDNPNFKYVMSRVTVNDGTDANDVLPELKHGAHSLTTTYEYSDGYYDRNKKDFYGFGTVKTTFAYGNCQEDVYFNREYYSKGCINSITVKTVDGALLSESTTTLEDAPNPLPKKEESRIYEKSSGTGCYIATATSYKYDLRYGNCIKITQDFGDGQKLSADITYDNTNATDYIIGLPVDIRVYDSNGNLLRHRSGDYDDLGQLKELRQYFDAYNYSVHTLKYDSYGNISSVTDSRGATVAYSYDGTENMFVTDIAQSGTDTDTYKGTIRYDIPTQTKRYEEDCSGNTINYDYDDWQRIVEIRTDYDGKEKSKTPAVSYEYNTPNNDSFGHHELWYAITNNKVTFDADDDSIIQTVLQIDGLGRAVRTAKTGFVNGVEGWNASGAVEYDEKGRTVKEGMTEFIQGDIQTLLESVPKMTALYTAYEYDEKDRQIKTILPDGSIQFAEFEIKDGKSVSYSIDPLGNVSVQETDSRGNIVRVAKNDKDGKQLTEVTYRYNEMGEMLNAYDAKGHPITAEYDLLGRRTALESLDSGRQEFFYDECSNLVRENNSVLRENNKQIVYEYDGLNRLVRIDYPDTEDTVYTYGDINDAHGAAGKILSVTDASGTLEYEYGKLGETTKETRTLSTHLNGNNPTETAVMEYRSDYLGRMQWITYPDGEKITYGYDKGGQVTSVTGEHYGHSFEYVTNILYDQYGQRTRIDYGNGTFTEYNYDPARRWLDKIKTQNKWGQGYQNISYSFDAVGNVLGYENDCLDSVTGNYKTKQSYSYDNLYQLIKVDGETTYNPYKSSSPEFVSNYSQLFEFDTDGLGNMTSKVSSETVTPHKTIGDNLNYSFNYVYNENYAHRLVRAGDRYYKYDANGNIVCEQDGSFESNGDDVSYHKITKETENVYSTDYGWGLFSEENGSGGGVKGSRYCRTYAWNEKNQLISSVDSNYNTAYVYGQDGQRSNKYTANSETLYFNKMWTLHTDSGNNIYGGQTAKNIYLGETRIVTKLNSGTNPTYQEEYYKQYYYHSDHLGSASLISDYKGDEYQRIEYTPYGETWVDKTSNTGLEWLPYKFTAKELDEETGLYYYGARYLDPKYSMWISTDPALGEYIPKAPIDEEAKKYNQNLPGMGGVFNHINGNLYHYAGNNPVRYIDPDGRSLLGNLCYVGAALVLAAGTTVSVISGGTLAVFVEPAAVKASLALAATGVAINTSELIKNNVESKQISIPQVQAKEKEQNTPTTIYRTGSGNGTNLTPRTPKDSTGLSYSLTKPLSGPYAVTTMEAVNATGVLSAVKDGPNHVSVVPNDMSKMPEWQASREHANETPHVYTKILQTISVKVKE